MFPHSRVTHAKMQIDKNMAQAPFGIYIHWPFCQKKCPYCDFNSHTQKNINQSAFTHALISELNYMVQRFGFENRALDSIFFGGGTPSLMQPAMLARILTAIETACKLDATCEITLEANPTTLEATKISRIPQRRHQPPLHGHPIPQRPQSSLFRPPTFRTRSPKRPKNRPKYFCTCFGRLYLCPAKPNPQSVARGAEKNFRFRLHAFIALPTHP